MSSIFVKSIQIAHQPRQKLPEKNTLLVLTDLNNYDAFPKF